MATQPADTTIRWRAARPKGQSPGNSCHGAHDAGSALPRVDRRDPPPRRLAQQQRRFFPGRVAPGLRARGVRPVTGAGAGRSTRGPSDRPTRGSQTRSTATVRTVRCPSVGVTRRAASRAVTGPGLLRRGGCERNSLILCNQSRIAPLSSTSVAKRRTVRRLVPAFLSVPAIKKHSRFAAPLKRNSLGPGATSMARRPATG